MKFSHVAAVRANAGGSPRVWPALQIAAAPTGDGLQMLRRDDFTGMLRRDSSIRRLL